MLISFEAYNYVHYTTLQFYLPPSKFVYRKLPNFTQHGILYSRFCYLDVIRLMHKLHQHVRSAALASKTSYSLEQSKTVKTDCSLVISYNLVKIIPFNSKCNFLMTFCAKFLKLINAITLYFAWNLCAFRKIR